MATWAYFKRYGCWARQREGDNPQNLQRLGKLRNKQQSRYNQRLEFTANATCGPLHPESLEQFVIREAWHARDQTDQDRHGGGNEGEG